MNPKYKSVERWIQQVHAMIPSQGFETAHLDELGYSGSIFASKSSLANLFADAAREIQRCGAQADLVLAVPLEPLPEIVKFPQPQALDLELLLAEAHELEPPSFFLNDPDLCLLDEKVEEYRCPIPWEIPGIPTASYASYFRIYREPEDIENDWEYYRALYIHWSP